VKVRGLDIGKAEDSHPSALRRIRHGACYSGGVPRAIKKSPSQSTDTVDAVTARRLLLHAQGLMDDPTQQTDERSLLTMIERLGFVQIDSINTIERAHHLTLLARRDGYNADI
jgi:hypothetical protein